MLRKIKRLFFIILIAPLSLSAQNQGVAFSKFSSWEELLHQAREENKYIFIDCYATWCGPCKLMDKNVYSNDSLGAFVNARFISIKIQMDSTTKKSDESANWRKIAKDLEKNYSIYDYPTFLFCSPDGAVVHEGIGYKDVNKFCDLANAATTPRFQYFTMLQKYKNGDLSYPDMPILANNSRSLYKDSVANTVAADYIDHFLNNLSDDSLWIQDNITFINLFQKQVRQKSFLFKRYFQARQNIDSLMKDPRYSDRLINSVIYEGIVAPAIALSLETHSEPRWAKLKKTINREYAAEYAEKNIILGKVSFYKSAKEWQKYAKYLVVRFKKAGIINYPPNSGTFSTLNNLAFEVFTYSSKRGELKMALAWVNRALSMGQSSHPSPFALDTKANLLYKLGKSKEAISIETECVKLAPANKEIQNNLEKMTTGVPTWPI